MISLWIPAATVERLAGVLLHFVWQGAAIALLAALALRFLRGRGPEWRYAAASAALAAMLLAPLVTFVFQAEMGALTRRMLRGVNEAAMQATSDVADADIAVWTQRIVALWVLGVVVLLMRLLGGWLLSRRLVRSASVVLTPAVNDALQRARTGLRFDAAVRLLTGAHIETPMVIGWLRPAILLPVSALTGLTPDQLLAIIAHELAHVRRRDFLVNALQRVVECLLFYHPAVWWVSGRIRLERERCCDDLAVGVCGNRLVYARALEALEKARAALPAVAVAGTGMGVTNRVRRILGVPGADRDWQSAVAATVFAAILVGAGTWQPPMLAEPAMRVTSQGAAGTARQSAGASDVTTAPASPLRTLVAIAAADGNRASAEASAQQAATTATSTVPQPSIAASREAAREKLGRLRVDYSAESFVKQAAEGDTIAVKTFLAAGMDINARGEAGYTALIKAAESKQFETVQALLAAGADPNLPGGPGPRTALAAAASAGEVPTMQVLLKAGAQPDLRATSPVGLNITPLVEAAWGGHVAAVTLLLDHKAAIDAQSERAGTALASAARTGRLDVVRLLLDRGADVNARMVSTGYTALFDAIERPHVDVMQLLLDRGADVNAVSATEPSPVVGPYITGVTPLLYALSRGTGTTKAPAALLLIERGANVNVVSPRGETALGLAAAKRMTAVVRALLDKGADPNQASAGQGASIPGGVSETALISALRAPASQDGTDIALLLIERGANVNSARKPDGQTPLIQALQTNQESVVRALLARGADPNLTNALGLTPIEVASREELRQLLITAGARP